jgi:hypothetical protein
VWLEIKRWRLFAHILAFNTRDLCVTWNHGGYEGNEAGSNHQVCFDMLVLSQDQ